MAPVCVDDYRRLAAQHLDSAVWDYLTGGSGDERTVAANLDAFARVSLRPRVLVDVSTRSTATSVLGSALTAPIGIAPTALHRLVHPDGEVATARGAAGSRAVFVVAMLASQPLEAIAEAAGGGPLWLQTYWLRQREPMVDLIARAEAAGFSALVATVDTPRMGRRLRDLRNEFTVDAQIAAANLPSGLAAGIHGRRQGHSSLEVHASGVFDASVTWADLRWLREQTTLPLVLKGVLTAEDAAQAVAAGVDGIVVSNHGGRQLAGAVASLTALGEVVDAVGGACPVLFDGGVRGGTDVFIALALGADLVLVGRPVLWALAVEGAAGVARMLESLCEELGNAMDLAGCPGIADIDRSRVRATW